jgi:hypothetical protein
VNGIDVWPTILGIGLVAVAAAFALLPFARGSTADSTDAAEPGLPDRFGLYRQLVELEFDVQLGKLAVAEYERLADGLLADASDALNQERGNIGELDAEIEREISAARAAFAAARRSSRSAGHQPRRSPQATEVHQEPANTPS